MPFTPTTPYDPDDTLNCTKAILIEYLQYYLNQRVDAEGVICREGYPAFDGKLPLANPHVTVYETAGSESEDVGYDDIFDGAVVVGSDTFVERGELQVYPFYVDVWTSLGTKEEPAASGGIIVRDRLKGMIRNALSRQSYLLPAELEVLEVRGGINTQPLSDQDQDICLARLYVRVRVPSTYRIQVS